VRRRAFVLGSATLALAGFARPDTLPTRVATFEEVGDSVLMTVAFPELLRARDREALASIDSGFETTLVYEVKIFEYGSAAAFASLRHVAKIHYDHWQKQYVVQSREASGAAANRYFGRQGAAISHAVSLKRLRIARASSLKRGDDGPYYFVTIRAMRNPLGAKGARRAGAASGRGQGRSPGWFRRVVEFMSGSQPRAEETLHVRTNPFYLVPR
jgi:hypothetical protein